MLKVNFLYNVKFIFKKMLTIFFNYIKTFMANNFNKVV